MAILNFTGWEQGNTLSIEAGDDYQPFQGSGGTGQVTSAQAKHGTYSLNFAKTSTNTKWQDFPTVRDADGKINGNSGSYAEMYIEFYFRYATKPSSAYEMIMEVMSSGGDPIAFLALNSSGNIVVYDFNNYSTPVLVATGSTALSANTWYKVQFKIVAGSSGSYQLKIDDTSDASGSRSWVITVNTRKLSLGVRRDFNSQDIDFYLDDLVVSDTAFILTSGEHAVKVLKPNANGSTMQWNGGTGASDYTQVDEIPIDDADYVMSPTSGSQVALFALQSRADVTIQNGNIYAVKAITISRRNSSSGTSTKVRIRSGSTNSDNASGFSHNTLSLGLGRLLALDPATGSAWTGSAIDALEIGELEESSVATRMLSALAHILYEVQTSVSVTVNATVVSATFSIPSRTVTGGATASPSAQVLTVSIPTYTVTAIQHITVSPSVLTATFSIQSATEIIDDSYSPPQPFTLTFSIPAYSVEAGAITANPSVQVLTFTIPTYTVSAIANISISPSTQSLTFGIPAYTASGEQSASVSASVQILTFSIPTYTATATANISTSVGVQAMTFSIPSYDPTVSVNIAPSVQVLTFGIPSYSIDVIANISISPESAILVMSIPSYTPIADFWQEKFPNITTNWNDKY
jgi:hypothetical protein